MTETKIIQFNADDLRTELREVLREVLQELEINEAPAPPSSGGIELAQEVLGRSKSWIYKSTSQNIIPFKKFGSKIIFTRTDLESWLAERAIDPSKSQDTIDNLLMKSAQKKLSKT